MIINIRVYPHSGFEKIEEVNENDYKVYLKKPAEDNKANIELLKLLKKHFKTPVRIIKGLKSRNKIIELKNG